MTLSATGRMQAIFHTLGAVLPEGGKLEVTCPANGSVLAMLTEDTAASLAAKVEAAAVAGKWFAQLPMAARAALLEQLAQAVRAQAEALGELITLEGGKTAKEGQGEAESASDVLLKTIKDASLPEFGGMLRRKERPPVGLVGLITSFNFPLVVANWTVAPALLAGNAVLWKPSEKTPLTALAYKHIFDNVMGEYRDILQVLVGGRSVGEGLVSHPAVGMISATGSVAMGRGIKAALANKPVVHPPILELGGNNGVVISEKISEEHAQWAVNSLMNSFLGTSGQRCTNTRRLIVHVSQLDAVIATLKRHITIFMNSGMVANPLTGESNAYGYGPLIDAAAFALFEKAKAEVVKAGGSVWGGKRIMEKDFPEGFYVEPALAVMPAQSGVMLEETFAPLLYVVAYKGGIDEAAALLNAPENAGLVSGIYTLSQQEADRFAALSEAGHVVINSPKGTGTPAFGMGFGGNKASGEGEILNAADPLRAFTKDTHYRRVAQYQDVVMSFS